MPALDLSCTWRHLWWLQRWQSQVGGEMMGKVTSGSVFRSPAPGHQRLVVRRLLDLEKGGLSDPRMQPRCYARWPRSARKVPLVMLAL